MQYRIISIAMTKHGIRQMKPRIYGCHPLNRHLGMATITVKVSPQNSHSLKIMQTRPEWGFLYGIVDVSYASHAYYSYVFGCVTDMTELLCAKHQLSSMTLKRSHLVELLL